METVGSSSLDQDFGLQTLGVVLLELCFGKAIEDHPMRQKYLSNDAFSDVVHDVAIAQLWYPDAMNETGTQVLDAIDWCLSNNVAVRSGEWRHRFVENVMLPLRDFQANMGWH